MMHPPGLRLRRQRERLGLSYRDVEPASFQIAMNRGRPDFILHISRLADIENNNVGPTLYKLFSLAAIYHLDPLELSAWYEAPFQQAFHEGASIPAPRTHLAESFLPPPFPFTHRVRWTPTSPLFLPICPVRSEAALSLPPRNASAMDTLDCRIAGWPPYCAPEA
jgi:transcriptional regulator with XRE-family HTH domain